MVLKTFMTRLRQGYQTRPYPGAETSISDRWLGKPKILKAACPADCRICVDLCPTGAITIDPDGSLSSLDMGACIFCGACANACPQQIIQFTREHRMATRLRQHLELTPEQTSSAENKGGKIKRLFGRSLKLRQVSAGGCNACEADSNVLTTPGFDLGRFGIQFVASPRHADGLLVTGPVTENMREALLKTYAAVPSPRLVIATGTCAISGGMYKGHQEAHNGVETILPVDVYIPGCPPHPLTILDGLLYLLDRRR